MAILEQQEHSFLTSVSRVSYANPFLPERIDYERQALGAEFDESHANWNLLGDDPETHQINTTKITQRAIPIINGFQAQLKEGAAATHEEIRLYEDTVLFLLFYNYAQNTNWIELITRNPISHQHNFSVRGGGEKSRYTISTGYQNDRGTTINTQQEKLNINSSFDYDISSKLKFTSDIMYTHYVFLLENFAQNFASKTSNFVPYFAKKGKF